MEISLSKQEWTKFAHLMSESSGTPKEYSMVINNMELGIQLAQVWIPFSTSYELGDLGK